MKLSEANFSDRTISLLTIPALYFIYFIALSACGFFFGLYVSATFRSASIWVGASLALAAIPAWIHIKATRGPRRDKIDIVFASRILLLCSVSGFLACSINRPNIDDSVYATKAVYYRDNPNHALDKTVNWIVGLPATAELPAFQYYETTQAALAYLFGLPYLSLYHVIFPAIVGFMMSLGALLVLSVFEERRWMLVLGLLLLTLVILSLGETEQTFGNYSIARAFHGKIFFVSAGLPMWLYLSLRFFATRRIESWVALLATGICLLATTNSAMALLPLFAAVIFASYVFSQTEIFTRGNFALGLAYLSALAPVLLIAWEFRTIAQRSLATRSLIATGFPLTFGGQLDFFINHRLPLTPILFCAALFVALKYSEHRRFFAIWVALMFVVFLNPISIDFAFRTVTPETIYWRLFYLLPFPIIVAIAFFSFPGRGRRSAVVTGGLFAVLALAAIWGPTSVLRNKGTMVGWPGLKIEEPARSAVKEIARTIPAGTMFAPVNISSNLLIYSSHYPQFHMRDDFLGYIAHESGVDQMSADRSSIYRYLYEGSKDERSKELLATMLASPGRPNIVVLPDHVASNANIQTLLTSHNYAAQHLSTAPYVLYLQPESELRAKSSS
jgi:hypothetical protein